jgi:hypothetical protein
MMSFRQSAGRFAKAGVLVWIAAALTALVGAQFYSIDRDRAVLGMNIETHRPVIVVREADGRFRAIARVRMSNSGKRGLSVYDVNVSVHSDELTKALPKSIDGWGNSGPPTRIQSPHIPDGGTFDCLQAAFLKPDEATDTAAHGSLQGRFEGSLNVLALSTAGAVEKQFSVTYQLIDPGDVTTFNNGYYGPVFPACPNL